MRYTYGNNKLFYEKCECVSLIAKLSREPRPANADRLIKQLQEQIEAIDRELRAERR